MTTAKHREIINWQAIDGKTIAMSFQSDDLKYKLESKGITVVDKVNKSIDLLIVKPSGNLQMHYSALSFGIPVVSEDLVTISLPSSANVIGNKRVRTPEGSPKMPKEKRLCSQSKEFRLIQDEAEAKRLESLEIDAAKQRMSEELTFLNKVIAFEGNIGAGKSTICSKLKAIEPTRCSVYKEQGNEHFLKLFYSDPPKYGFAYQWGMLKTRRYQLSLAQQDIKFGRVPPKQYYFWDRSMVGDYIFALWNHLLGGISKQEMDVYENEFGGSIKKPEDISFLSEVSCYIVLDDEPANCKHRVENFRGNASESSIPLDYYQGIDDIHFDIFIRRVIPNKISKVLVLSWGQYDSERELWDNLESVIQRESEDISSITVEENFDPNNAMVDEKTTKIYKTEQDILYSYTLFTTKADDLVGKNELDALIQFRDVFIPQNIMEISENEKKVVENDFGVKFYHNEYKRVVMRHLSKSQALHFYTV